MKRALLFASTFGVMACSTPTLQGQQPDGQALYKKECKSCHGVTGVPPARAKEQYPKIKTLGQDGFVANLTADSIVVILKKGLGKDMKSMTGKLTAAEMAAVASYIKELAERKKPPA